jgi:hypothetical protein
MQFRSASVVKLLITLDYLWNRGPDYTIPAADRSQLDVMLRSSDDGAASSFWVRGGYEQVINRMVPRLGLLNTAPPPASQRGYWGYTAISAADTVRIYRYLLDSAPAPVRDYMMGNLHQSTRCGTDHFDEYFGIPGAFNRPWAVKQGWSGFADPPQNPCSASAPDTPAGTAPVAGAAQAGAGAAKAAAAPGAVAPAAVDLVSEALHTTGTVGAGDRTIVALYTLHPDGTPFATAYTAVTQLARSLPVPGATASAPASWWGTWSSNVPVRSGTTNASPVVRTIPAGSLVRVQCQKVGESVTVGQYTNDLWAYLPEYRGYLTNIYFSYPENRLPDVPDC